MEKLLIRYKNISAPVKASIWFAICSVFQKGVSFITMPIFTRILTSEQYGVFTVYSSWYSIITIIATLNLSAGVYNNCITKFSNDRRVVTSTLQGLSTTVTAILFVIYIAFINFWTNLLDLSPLFMFCMFAELLFVPAYLFWSVGQRYDYKYKGIVIVSVILSISSPLVGIIAVLSTNYKAEARVISNALVQVVLGLIFYIFNFKSGKKFYSKEYWLYALKFNIPLIPHYLSQTVLNQADRIMISRMISPSASAVYSVAYSISLIMSIITNAINSSFVPYSYKSIKECNYTGLKKTSNIIILIIGGMSILNMAFGPELVLIIGGKEYYDAIWVIPPIAASVFFMALYPLFANFEFYYEKTIYVMIASCSGAILNIILNYIFIKLFGYYAAGYTTLFCYIIFVIVHYIFQQKIVDKNVSIGDSVYDMKVIVLLSIIELTVMILMVFTYNFWYLRYGIIIIVTSLLLFYRKKIISVIQQMKK